MPVDMWTYVYHKLTLTNSLLSAHTPSRHRYQQPPSAHSSYDGHPLAHPQIQPTMQRARSDPSPPFLHGQGGQGQGGTGVSGSSGAPGGGTYEAHVRTQEAHTHSAKARMQDQHNHEQQGLWMGEGKEGEYHEYEQEQEPFSVRR